MSIDFGIPAESDSVEYTILIVDDNPTNLGVIFDYLKGYGFRITVARDGESALKRAEYVQPDIILLDVMMPGMDGFETCRKLKANPGTQEIPVIFMTALTSIEDKVKGFAIGAVDYVTKPIQQEEILARVNTHLRIRDLTRELQEANQALSKRAAQLETSSEVGQKITAMLEMDDLLLTVVRLIQTRFAYYFVGVWRLNEQTEEMILRAGSGRMGHSLVDQGFVVSEDKGAISWPSDDEDRPLEKGFVIPSGAPNSIVAHVGRTGQYYLANDVSVDLRYLPLKMLPDTKSELALPLRIGQETIGVLDIQSDRMEAFDLEDRTVLQMLADQVAIAIQNARLYAEIVRFNQELEDMVRERTAELQKAYNQLERLDRNKSDFIQVVSHELRTPLAIFTGYSQLLLEYQAIQEDQTLFQIASRISQSSLRLREIVSSMLEVAIIDSRVLQLSYSSVSLPELIQQVYISFEDALRERNLTLDRVDLETLPIVEADGDELSKVFQNLVSNAIKYTPDGKQITISGKAWSGKKAGIALDFVEVIISDTGIGIDPQSHELIFTKFYQAGNVAFHSSGKTKFKGGGPGLGLAMSRGIVEAHGGRIWVESPGYDEQTCPGSRFHVVLPQHRPPQGTEVRGVTATP